MTKSRTKVMVLWVVTTFSMMLTGCSGSTGYSESMPSMNTNRTSYSSDSYDSSFGGFDTDAGYTFNESEDTYYEETAEEIGESGSYDSDDGSVHDDGIDNTSSGTSKSAESTSKTLYQDKLVYRCSLEIETLNYEESYAKLKTLLDKYECRIESEYFSDDNISYYTDYRYATNGYINGKTSNMIIRVPSSNYNDFVEENGSLGNITSKQSSIENITQEYYDTTAQVKGLEMQLNRLQEMLKQAYDVEDMIEINKEITDVQNQINKLKTHIRTMDMDTTYSYVTISLKEVLEYTEDEPETKTNTFVDRLKNQISDTWKGFLVFLEETLFTLIALIPTIFVLGVIWIIIRVIFNKKIQAYKKLRKEQKEKTKSLGELMTYREPVMNQPNGLGNNMQGMNQGMGQNIGHDMVYRVYDKHGAPENIEVKNNNNAEVKNNAPEVEVKENNTQENEKKHEE